MRTWDAFLTERDRRVYHDAGFGAESGIGDRAALVIIDVTYGFTGDGPEPIEESIKKYPTSCGEAAWESIPAIAQLLGTFRRLRLPVFYTLTEWRADAADVGRWAGKSDAASHPAMIEGNRGGKIVDEIAPQAGEIVLSKKKPSAFFGTPLPSYLIDQRVDTVIITGCTTSGCVRASVIDAFSYNYRVVIPEECVFDRGEASHAVNLFDMQQKYADVRSTESICDDLTARYAETAAR